MKGTAYREGDLKRIGELWRKRGAIGRLNNIVRYIRASPQRRQFFKSIVIGGELAEFDGLEVSLFMHSFDQANLNWIRPSRMLFYAILR